MVVEGGWWCLTYDADAPEACLVDQAAQVSSGVNLFRLERPALTQSTDVDLGLVLGAEAFVEYRLEPRPNIPVFRIFRIVAL